MPVEKMVLKGISQFHDWASQHDIEWLFTERVIYSKALNYAGTADFGAYIDGKLTLGDYKTGKNVYTDHGMQTASYACALREELEEWEACRNRMIVHMDVEGGNLTIYDEQKIQEEVSGHDIQGDMEAFASCRVLYEWDRRNKNLWRKRWAKKTDD